MHRRLSALQSALTAVFGSEDSEANRSDRSLADAGRPGPRETLIQMGLPPEEYLGELIRGHGGRVWQQALVEETGWNDSSISHYLSVLEDEGRISRQQIGRRKAVGFPGSFESTDTASQSKQLLDA